MESMDPGWLGWLLSVSDSWAYTIFRIGSLAIGTLGFLVAFVIALAAAIGAQRARFQRYVLVGVGFGLLGWGWPMLLAMALGLDGCELTKLVFGAVGNPPEHCVMPSNPESNSDTGMVPIPVD